MPRSYNLGRRTASVEETRRRIAKAALNLHTTKGPAQTSMQDIARLADVSLVTVYRHFPTPDQLFQSCRRMFLEEHPLPTPESISGGSDLRDRVQRAITLFYSYYDEAGEQLWCIQRDADLIPELLPGVELRQGRVKAVAEAALAPVHARPQMHKRMLTLLLLALDLGTWRHLVKFQGLTTQEATSLMTEAVLCGA